MPSRSLSAQLSHQLCAVLDPCNCRARSLQRPFSVLLHHDMLIPLRPSDTPPNSRRGNGMLRLISSPPKLGGVRGGLNQGHTTAFSDCSTINITQLSQATLAPYSYTLKQKLSPYPPMILCIFMIIRTKNIVGLPFYPTMYPLCTPYDSLLRLRSASWFCL